MNSIAFLDGYTKNKKAPKGAIKSVGGKIGPRGVKGQ